MNDDETICGNYFPLFSKSYVGKSVTWIKLIIKGELEEL